MTTKVLFRIYSLTPKRNLVAGPAGHHKDMSGYLQNLKMHDTISGSNIIRFIARATMTLKGAARRLRKSGAIPFFPIKY